MTDISALGLTAGFETVLATLLRNCAARGIILRPYFGIRDPVTQAKLYRQSRSWAEIQSARAGLARGGAAFLVKCLDDAGTSHGPFATNALPGFSFHQYGTACDCVWIRDGAEEWSASINGAANGYTIYAEEATKLGLRTLGHMGDYGHVQQSEANSPGDAYTVTQINAIMESKFGGT
jgi:peptidoglycan LD-endopeptidase CwlK